MATSQDLENDWSMLWQDTNYWTYADLQLAAELGKTLLERNKELENIIKLHQSTVEEQAQEIEYMKKQTAALKEVNNSRLKIYEQLEVSVQDLERANHRLVIENTSDKKLIKSQCMTIESLEIKCEELQKKIDDLTEQHEALLRQAASPSRNNAQQDTDWKTSITQGGSVQQRAAPSSPKSFQETTNDANVRQATTTATSDEEITELLRQLQDARSQRAREQMKVSELNQQLSTLLQENSALEEQLTMWRNKAQDVKNLQDEINTLEEVRRDQLCGRCLRGMDSTTHDELSIMLDQEEYDDISMAESLIGENQRDSESVAQDTCNKNEGTDELDSTNPYRVLVEKYQALLEAQRHCQARRKDAVPATCMSLQEELEMSGEFKLVSPFVTFVSSEVEAAPETKTVPRAKTDVPGKKVYPVLPVDLFAEVETSSSGFSDEMSNKATQTDGRPGSFLCSIDDGEDCKFSIYDDNSPFESRFRKTPEYRQLFSEIFGVLKRAAEAKDEGEKLPLLDNSQTSQTTFALPLVPVAFDSHNEMVTSRNETIKEDDDSQSVMSSVVSSVVSEPVFRVHPASPASVKDDDKSNKTANKQEPQHGTRLDYLSINVHVRRKSSAKKNSAKKAQYNDRPTTPDVIPTTNPKFIPPKPNTGSRRKFKPFNPQDQDHTGVWNGQRGVYLNRSRDRRQHAYTRSPNEQSNNYEYSEFKPSTASEDVARLKRLELSYAEVLRTPNKPKVNNRRRS